MRHGFQQIVTEAECRYNFVVHGLAPQGNAMTVASLMWRKKLMDSISGNLGELSKRVEEIAGLEVCKIKVFPPAFWPITEEILSDKQQR
jgi:hypothetical protein